MQNKHLRKAGPARTVDGARIAGFGFSNHEGTISREFCVLGEAVIIIVVQGQNAPFSPTRSLCGEQIHAAQSPIPVIRPHEDANRSGNQ